MQLTSKLHSRQLSGKVVATTSDQHRSLDKAEPNSAAGIQTQQVLVQSQQWAGPLPPPAVLERYESVVPGLAERIVASMEREQEHRHRIDRELIETHRVTFTRGQWIAALIAVLCMALAFVLGINGHSAPAIAFVTGGLGQVILAFLGSRETQRKEPE